MNGLKKDYKVVIIGDSHVGKTTLLKKFIGKPEVGREPYVQKTIERNDRQINLQIHDTMGQERFRSLTTSYYRGSDGCLVCFDIMNQSTFDGLKNWLLDLKDCVGNKRISVLLVGLNSKNFPTQGDSTDANRNSISSLRVEQSKIDLFREEHRLPVYVEVNLTSSTDATVCFETLVDIMIEDLLKSQQKHQNAGIGSSNVYVGHTSLRQDLPENKKHCAC